MTAPLTHAECLDVTPTLVGPLARFWEKVAFLGAGPDECWEWRGTINGRYPWANRVIMAEARKRLKHAQRIVRALGGET